MDDVMVRLTNILIRSFVVRSEALKPKQVAL